MLLTLPRNIINLYPNISAILAGLICSLTHAPTFFTPGIIGLSILVYLVYSSPKSKNAFIRNIWFGLGYFGYGFYWTSIAISTFIEDFGWAIPIALLGLPLIFCFFTSLVALCAWYFRTHSHYVMIYSFLWVFIEWLTSFIFTGLPWMLVGYSTGFSDILSQTASIFGVFGLSFIIFHMSATFYYIWEKKNKIIKVDIYYIIIILSVLCSFGFYRLSKNPTAYSDLKIRIVQPSIAQTQKWAPEVFRNNLNLHKDLSSLRTMEKPDIILWSEAAITAPHQIPELRKYLNSITKELNVTLITGSISEINDKPYTSVIAINPHGDLLFEYHKQHLVPFGEYVPLRKFLPIKKLTHGLADYTAGTTEKEFYMSEFKTTVRPMICYESIFSSEILGTQADILFNFTNSAWYGHSNAPAHLFYANKFRAIENGIPVITAANNGISGVIDPVGRIISKTKIDDITILDSYAPKKINTIIPYTRIGLISLLIAIVLVHIMRFFSYKLEKNTK